VGSTKSAANSAKINHSPFSHLEPKCKQTEINTALTKTRNHPHYVPANVTCSKAAFSLTRVHTTRIWHLHVIQWQRSHQCNYIYEF